MYELFVLGQLMDAPMSGYALRRAMGFVLGQPYVMSWGSLYPLLNKLAAAGEIVLTEDQTNESRRNKKQAAITGSGRVHFQTLVMTPVKLNKQTDLTFQIKFNFLHLLSATQANQILTAYQDHCVAGLAELAEHQQKVIKKGHLTPADTADFMALYQLQKNRLQVQLDWVRDRQQSVKN